jgi:hypothetical protein
MRKVLIVGLGGSGGKTLSFIMDELKVILKDNGWKKDSLPECWKFVHIDVPSSADAIGKGLAPSVEAQGGKYIGLASATNYPIYDRVAFDNFNNSIDGLRSFARWRPVPSHQGGIDIAGGAGAFRAIGRVVTLTKSAGIYGALDSLVTSLRADIAQNDLEDMSACFDSTPKSKEMPLVLLVSSMAGGSGASMVLDVADILRGIQPGSFSGGDSAAFLYTADVFKSLPSAYKGAASGTLATLSELTNSLSAWDTSFTDAYWKSIVPSVPLQNSDNQGRGPKLVFPIGSEARGVPFGKGPEDVYRGFAKMLSPLFYNENLQNEFGAYVQTNWMKRVNELGRDDRDKQKLITKVVDKDGRALSKTVIRPMLFPTWGSSSLSMGRDRYKEYAAQRIGREMAAILQEGFRQSGSNEIGLEESISKTAESIYPAFLQIVDLGGDGTSEWKQNGKLAFSILKQMGDNKSRISKMASTFTENFSGTRTAVVNKLKGKLTNDSPERDRELADIAVHEVQKWLTAFTQRLDNAVLFSLSRGGFETTKRVLETFKGELISLQNALTQSASTTVTSSKDALATNLQRHSSSNEVEKPGSAFFKTISDNFTSFVKSKITEKTSLLLADVLGEVSNKLIGELHKALESSRHSLNSQLMSTEESATSAAYRDAPITTWPKGTEVPQHFKPTVNEVVITSDEEYDAAFKAHISAESGLNGPESLREIAELILFRKFFTGGTVQPKVGLTSEPGYWHPSLESNSFNWKVAKLNNGASSTPRYTFSFDSNNLRELAFEYVSITGSAFELYTRESISDWLQSDPSNEDMFKSKLSIAIDYASPLVGIDSKAVEIFHGNDYEGIYYTFTDIPIAKSSRAIRAICASWGAAKTAQENIDAIEKNCDVASSAKEIFIRSETPPYLPWVFSSLTKPVRDNMSVSGSNTAPVWSSVRARQLREFVPLGTDLVEAFLRGWLVGRITGLVQLESSTAEKAYTVKVFSTDPAKKAAESFGVATLGVNKLGMVGEGNDSSGLNIPAVLLETLPLALASASSDIGLLQPYLDLIEIGLEMKSVGGVESHRMTGLDLWFTNQKHWQESQLSFKRSDGVTIPSSDMNERRQWALDWLSQNIEYLQAVDSQKISEQNFWKLNPEYEIARELVQAARKVQAELSRPGLGQVENRAENTITLEEEIEEPQLERPEH